MAVTKTAFLNVRGGHSNGAQKRKKTRILFAVSV